MDANTVIAICSVVVAGASLAVSAYVAWATWKHNPLSVRPVLGFRTTYSTDGTSGLILTNSGLGSARIIKSMLTYDGVQFGQFNKSNVDDRYIVGVDCLIEGQIVMTKTQEQKVLDSFDKSDHEDVTKYLDWLLATISGISQNIRRMATIALLLIAIFEIIAQSPSVQFTLGTFHITRNSIVFTFIPAVVAYLYFQVVVDTANLDQASTTFQAAFKQWSAKAEENDLQLWVTPSMPAYWNFGVSSKTAFQKSYDRVELSVSVFLTIGILLGTLVFEGLAYDAIFSPNLSHNIPWFISVCISFFFLSSAVTHLTLYWRE